MADEVLENLRMWTSDPLCDAAAKRIESDGKEIERLRAFATWAVRSGPFDGSLLDGYDVQEKAVEFGILRPEKYDPEKHGSNDCDAQPGDEWFVFTYEQ